MESLPSQVERRFSYQRFGYRERGRLAAGRALNVPDASKSRDVELAGLTSDNGSNCRARRDDTWHA